MNLSVFSTFFVLSPLLCILFHSHFVHFGQPILKTVQKYSLVTMHFGTPESAMLIPR